MAVPEKSKVLIIGATGYIGRHLVEASMRLGHPTFALVREATIASNLEKAELIKAFKSAGVTVVFGDLHDQESLVKAIRQVDVVYSVMGHEPKQLADQMNIISAIQEAGTVKRYFPSEYGFDVDRVQVMEPAKSSLESKAQIRHAIKKAGIPFTFVSSNFCAKYFLSRLGQVEATGLPEGKVVILGDGNPSVIYVNEPDIATYAIKAADDPRTLNKVLYVRPPANIYSLNQLASLYEKKTNKTLQRVYVPEEEIIKKIRDSPGVLPFFYAIAYASYVKGEQTNFEIDPLTGIEASALYPEVKYTTVDECLDHFM